MKAIYLSIICLLSSQFVKSQINIDYAFSYPGIVPAEDLEISNPNSSQLDPNKIHLVILGRRSTLNLSGLAPGIYYCRVMQGNSKLSPGLAGRQVAGILCAKQQR